MIEFTDKKINENDVRCISGNVWNEACEKETDKYLEGGLWVCFCASCIGHTRAQMFENAGVNYICDKYGEFWLERADAELGTRHYRLK